MINDRFFFLVSICREQQLLNVFEVVISTLEGKLQRIDNLDKAVEHLMRRVESLDSKVADNIIKTDAVINRLRDINNKLSDEELNIREKFVRSTTSSSLNSRLLSLDQKVGDIDQKLVTLKNQIDNNFLPIDDINAEASEKKTVSMNVHEITKAMNAEVMGHVTKELDQLRKSSDSIDKKLQYHISLVSDNIGKMLNLVKDVHEAVVEPNINYTYNVTTTTLPPFIKSSKIDALVNQMKPIMSVSEKMDEVWDVVVGTKSSVDDLLPKSDELLTHTQRQERAIGQIHKDLRTNTNLIIENLDMVEKRLKKQEDDVAILAQRPVPSELLLDPTIDRLVEYDSNRYVIDDITEQVPTTYPQTTTSNPITGSTTSPVTIPTIQTTTTQSSNVISNTIPTSNNATSTKSASRKGGIIFPSVKNKPSVVNTTFTSDILSFKDVKVSPFNI